MAKRIYFEEDGLDGSGPVPAGYKQIGYEGATFSEKSGYTSSTVGGGGGLSYKVYKALLSQSGTASPVATILVNTLSGTPVWSYTSVGNYLLTLIGEWTDQKTSTRIEQSSSSANCQLYTYRNDADTIKVAARDLLIVGINDVLWETTITIEVYP